MAVYGVEWILDGWTDGWATDAWIVCMAVSLIGQADRRSNKRTVRQPIIPTLTNTHVHTLK